MNRAIELGAKRKKGRIRAYYPQLKGGEAALVPSSLRAPCRFHTEVLSRLKTLGVAIIP